MNQTIRESKSNRTPVLADITEHEKTAAKALAKSKGMTFQGFVGQLIRQALAESEGSFKQQSYLEGGR